MKITISDSVEQTLKLTRLQVLCLEYQFRLRLKQGNLRSVTMSTAYDYVTEIAEEFSLPKPTSVEQVTALLKKHKLLELTHG